MMTGTSRSLVDMDSIGRSLRNCSLTTTASESGENHVAAPHLHHLEDNALELNSHVRLPHYWEQCLDLNTGEVYYINWKTGMKSREDPRMMSPSLNDARLAEESTLEEQGYVGGEESSYSEEEESSSPSSSSSTTTKSRAPAHYYSENESSGSHSNNNGGSSSIKGGGRREEVLVVAGCKACFMYLMVPKQVEECPKCYGQVIHFDRSDSDT